MQRWKCERRSKTVLSCKDSPSVASLVACMEGRRECSRLTYPTPHLWCWCISDSFSTLRLGEGRGGGRTSSRAPEFPFGDKEKAKKTSPGSPCSSSPPFFARKKLFLSCPLAQPKVSEGGRVNATILLSSAKGWGTMAGPLPYRTGRARYPV